MKPARTSTLSCLAALGSLFALLPSTPFGLTSPDGKVEVEVSAQSGRLGYQVSFQGATVIQTSPLGITVGGQDLGADAVVGATAADSVREEYPTLGKKSRAVNHYRNIPPSGRSPGPSTITRGTGSP
jgi:hypothetical protein